MFVDDQIREKFNFSGLATFYQSVSYYLINQRSIEQITTNEKIVLEDQQWFAAVGRFMVLLVSAPSLTLRVIEGQLQLDPPLSVNLDNVRARIIFKNQLTLFTSSPGISVSGLSPPLPFDQLRYSHLWAPFAWLSKVIEATLVGIQAHLVSNWGWAIVLLSLFIKVLLLPVSIKTVELQRQVSKIQAQLAPKLATIKAEFSGEDAHNRLMAAHSNIGVSPFYALKPISGSLIQIPVLIAVFNALAEMPQLDGQAFFWISDLAYPDVIIVLNQALPFLGSNVNLLPLLMTLVTVLATALFSNRYATVSEVRRQKRNLYLMAAAFLVVFYSFPAAMVLYWLSTNIFHTFQQHWLKI
ncbi:MAG: membrane protein insertase YidC [Immundisolibacteraceae bacterium]|nr:membrane protein insertase YidC [Immundisolibacteraceae bacterium]